MISQFKLLVFLVFLSLITPSFALAAPLAFRTDHQALLSNETISGIPKATQEIKRIKLEEVYNQTKFSTDNTMLVFYLKTKKKAYAFDEVAYLKIEKYQKHKDSNIISSIEVLQLKPIKGDKEQESEAKIIYSPCDYLQNIAVTSTEMEMSQKSDDPVFQVKKMEQVTQDKQGKDVKVIQYVKPAFMNFKVSIVKKSPAANQNIAMKIGGEGEYELQVWMVQPPHINNYLCEKGLVGNQVSQQSMVLGDDNQGTNEMLENEPNSDSSKLYQQIEFVNSEKAIYVLGGVQYMVNNTADKQLGQVPYSLDFDRLSHHVIQNISYFNLTDNSWKYVEPKEEKRSPITGHFLNQVVRPKLSLGQSLSTYDNFLILFGGNQPFTNSQMKSIKGQFKSVVDHSNLWFFDSKINDWYLIRPEEIQDETKVERWPVDLNYKRFMTATTILQKGIIFFIGGEQTVFKIQDSLLPTSSGIWELDVDLIVQQIQQMQLEHPLKKILKMKSYLIWKEFILADDKDTSLVDLSGHSSILLPDLNQILIIGGQSKGVPNKKVFVLNIVDRSLKILEPQPGINDFNEIPRLRPSLNLLPGYLQSNETNIVCLYVQGGIGLQQGEILDDLYHFDVDVENMKYRSTIVYEKTNLSYILKENTYMTYLESSIMPNSTIGLQIQGNTEEFIEVQGEINVKPNEIYSFSCPFGFIESTFHGLQQCKICDNNSYFNQTSAACQQCQPDNVCFLGSAVEKSGLKNVINKFNITNYPTLYGEFAQKKNILVEDYSGLFVQIVIVCSVLLIIFIHLKYFEKFLTTFIVHCDFTLITGGNSSFSGGLITLLYYFTLTFLCFGLLQEQINLNEWIESTSMASQNSDLLVSNTLFIQIDLHVTQISLNQTDQDNEKLNLCDPQIFSLKGNFDKATGIDNSKIKKQRCIRQVEHDAAQGGNEFIYTVQMLVDDFVLEDASDLAQLNISLSKLAEVQNETIFINYFNYAVLTKWNEKDTDVTNGMQIKEFADGTRLRSCKGCSRLEGISAVQDYTDKTFARDSWIKINLKASPVYYENFLNYDAYSGYQLQYISQKISSHSKNSSDNYQSQISARDISLFKKNDGTLRTLTFAKFQPQHFKMENQQPSEKNLLQVKVQQVQEQILGLKEQLRDNFLHAFQQTNDEISNTNHDFLIQFKFNLSENITQVRVTTRKSVISAVAEAMAFFAGLSFWSKLFKYFITINHIGRYYDRRYKIFTIEEKKPLRNNDSLGNKNQFFAQLEGPNDANEPPNTSNGSRLKLKEQQNNSKFQLRDIRSQGSGKANTPRDASAYNFSGVENRGVMSHQYGSNQDHSKSREAEPEHIELQLQ